MEVSAKDIFEAVASKIENQYRLSANNFKFLKSKVSKLAAKSKHFSVLEVECLVRQFYTLLGHQGSMLAIKGMDKQEFYYILDILFGIDTKIMMDRIFATLDFNKDGFISVDEWVESLAIFLRGNLEEKTQHTFQVYDLNSDRCISKVEMMYLLKNGEIGETKRNQELDDLLDMTFKVVDYDRDGLLSYPDFQKSVQKESLYLEAFGKCLPDSSAVMTFENHLTELLPIVKAKGKQELNVPTEGCYLNSKSKLSPSHVRPPTTSSLDKMTEFLPSAMRLVNFPPVSPDYTPKSKMATSLTSKTKPTSTGQLSSDPHKNS